jgi:hypothetical protein
MQERERVVISGLIILMLILALGFFAHRSTRFAGSLAGGALGVSGALLMLSGPAYALVKRVGPLQKALTGKVSLRTMLAWHVYTGIAGAILALLHTGHKFQSPLGMLLTAAMMLVVFTGYVGRYLFNAVAQELREKREALSTLQAQYDATSIDLGRGIAPGLPTARLTSRLVTGFFLPSAAVEGVGDATAARALRLAEAMADLEYSIKMHDVFKTASSRWLKWHIAISIVFYLLLGFHVWAGLFYGLRWFHP